ncbi:hypothetical protein F5Y16DRAFT_355998 [Xylariaceae sp. FL0255]|nr:hypothetical protein F5Y16DRAFT_355998 [Xylariaceae sp. FL0255]
MKLVEGETLKIAWPSLSENDKKMIFKDQYQAVDSWLCLRQAAEPYYVISSILCLE